MLRSLKTKLLFIEPFVDLLLFGVMLWQLLGGVFLRSIAAQQNVPLQISSPTSGTIVGPGTTLTVSVSSPNGTAFSQLALVGIGFNVLATNVPAQFSIAIPANADCRLYTITANGVTTSGQGVTSAPIQIDIERSDSPGGLSSTTTGLNLESIGEQSPLVLLGTFRDADGTMETIDVTESTNVTYVSSNTTVATIGSTGVVTVVGPGTALITAKYTSNGNSFPISIPVTVPIPMLTVSPSSLSFGNQTIGTSSSPQQVTMTNSGIVNITISSLNTTGNFSETDNCVSTSPLAPNGTCTANIVFSPTAAGSRNGTLAVVNSSTVAPATIALTGTGVTVPYITSLSPSSGAVGTSVTITGVNFGASQGSSTATFNGTAAAPTSWSNTSIVVPVPTGATTGNVIVTVGGVASNGISFTVGMPPNITSINPTSGFNGTTVTITGTNFGATQGTSTVTFNGTAGTPSSWSDTSIVVRVPSSVWLAPCPVGPLPPPGPCGTSTVDVVVTVGGVASNTVQFTAMTK